MKQCDRFPTQTLVISPWKQNSLLSFEGEPHFSLQETYTQTLMGLTPPVKPVLACVCACV